jgi:hypothetical protein
MVRAPDAGTAPPIPATGRFEKPVLSENEGIGRAEGDEPSPSSTLLAGGEPATMPTGTAAARHVRTTRETVRIFRNDRGENGAARRIRNRVRTTAEIGSPPGGRGWT